eukprot:TRINITY_DN33688_c0_g1_i1.p1 TRINITY_DN33688_c0_g1~~TRINITY_DN33688_c0_g1_i1.p1  ORF type:complete len:734 (-),score=110.97 TRINITY_DN33688_c0_g1_i1:168-2264(-)
MAAITHGSAAAAPAFLDVCAVLQQRRNYTPPSRRTWSKQHHRIRTPRPMVDKFDLWRVQPQKEWWRERPVAPATFFGFPDVSQHNLRGGSLYVEQMDAVTLAVLADKCVKDKVWDPMIWSKFSWRAQQIASRTHEPDLCYIFRAFSRIDWVDQNLLTTYLGRMHRRLHMFQLLDVAVLLEAFGNPRFRQSIYLQKALTHLSLLLQHRDDAKPEDLARTCAALRALKPESREVSREVRGVLELLADALLLRDLGDLGVGRAARVLDCYVTWEMAGSDRGGPSTAATDLCWALLRSLKGQLRNHGREHPGDLATLAMAMSAGKLDHDELWKEIIHNLKFEAHRLTGPEAAMAVFAAARSGRGSTELYEALGRRLDDRSADLKPIDCARSAGGLLCAPRSLAERFVLRGSIFDRVMELGLEAFDAQALVMLLDGLGRAPPAAFGVETMAGAILEMLEVGGRLGQLSARQLASVARCLGRLRPQSPEILRAVLDRAQSAAAEALEEDAQRRAAAAEVESPASEELDALDFGPLAPRHVAMLCQGIASQPKSLLPDAPARIQALLPQVAAALSARPPAAKLATSFIASLTRCPSAPLRNEALTLCAERLCSRAKDLPCRDLVALTEDLAYLASPAGGKWVVPEALLLAVVRQIDIKRYDLQSGILWRVERALVALSSGSEMPKVNIRLEERDMQPQGSASRRA